MKVLQVVDGTGWGGTKEQVYLTTRELKKKGVDVHIALNEGYQQMIEKLQPYNVPVHFFEDSKPNPRYRWSNYKRLIEIVNKNKFDIVVANSPKAMDYVAVASYFFKPKPKIVAFKRTGKPSGFFSKYLKYDKADRIVVVDRTTYELLVRTDFFPEKLVHIPSGVDLSRFYRFPVRKTDYGFSEDSVILINIANWIPHHKGQPFLIEAFSRAGCGKCILLLVGTGTETYARDIAKKFGVEDRVIGLGFRDDVPRLLNMADFFVFSSYFEGIAGAVLQAMACGKVVLSTYAGGIKDYLVDGYNGFGVQVGDMEGYVEKLKNLLNLDRESYTRISENAIKTASEYSIEKTVDRHIQLYAQLISC